MDDLPKFLGPWEEHYAKRQAKFNMQLAAAVAFFLTTSFVVSGTVPEQRRAAACALGSYSPAARCGEVCFRYALEVWHPECDFDRHLPRPKKEWPLSRSATLSPGAVLAVSQQQRWT